MRPLGAGKAITLPVLVLMLVLASGCLDDGGGGGETVLTDLTIDFMGGGASINPGNITTWENVSGQWVITTQSNGGYTRYVFINLTADNCLGQITAAAELAGFEIRKSYYSSMGSWLVIGIDGVENQVTGRNWQFWVNEDYAVQGAYKVSLSEGDCTVWKYEQFATAASSNYLHDLSPVTSNDIVGKVLGP